MAGAEDADSWTTDAHKTLNVPYDCGIAIVRDPADSIAMFRTGGDYLVYTGLDPWDVTPELSRRARGVPVWAALRSLGRAGVAALVDRLHANAVAMAEGLARHPRRHRRQRGPVHPGDVPARRRRRHACARRRDPRRGHGRGDRRRVGRACGAAVLDVVVGDIARRHRAESATRFRADSSDRR